MRRWYIDSDSIKMIPRLHLFWVNVPQDIKGAIPSRKCPIMSSAAMKKVLNETLQYYSKLLLLFCFINSQDIMEVNFFSDQKQNR